MDDPLTAFVVAYRMARADRQPVPVRCDPLRAFMLGCWPWAAGDRHRAIRVRPDFLSGRRILA